MVLKINALHVYTLVHVRIFSSFIVSPLSNFQLPGERNYHVFYRLLSGMPADKLAKLRLTKDPWAYNYLTKVSPISLRNVLIVMYCASLKEILQRNGTLIYAMKHFVPWCQSATDLPCFYSGISV